MTIHTPYHFVPLSKWVLLPEWAHLISHDIPFEDGLCGTIEYTLKNSSPLLVGGNPKKDPDDNTVKWAKDPDGKPIIPGSSIKGMLRSVMEIATFSKMGFVDDSAMSYRDFGNTDYTTTLKDTKAQAAWLRYDADKKKWTIKRVSHSLIDDKMLNQYGKQNGITSIDHEMSAVEKYSIWTFDNALQIKFILKATTNNPFRKITTEIGSGDTLGNLVFTDPRIGATLKDKEYLRFNYVYHQNNEEYQIILDTKLINDFFNFHNEKLINHLKNNPHNDYGIPVFIRTKGSKIQAIGIAKLPKIPYNFTTKTLVLNQQPLFENNASFDMTECIFGMTRDNGMSLKSRVSFSDLKNHINRGISKEINKVLSSPRESYLAAYIDGNNQTEIYRGYNSKENKIKGVKVYPRNKTFDAQSDNESNDAMISRLEFLNKNSTFIGEIHYHNLKPEELGALIWSLNFGQNNESPHCHGLGHAKPYGAGNVKIKIDKIDNILNNGNKTKEYQDYINEFITFMEDQHYDKNWEESAQLKHLLSFAIPSNENLKYMDLEKGDNSFKSNKSEKNTITDWKGINRNEPNYDSTEIPESYAKGRLSILLDEDNIYDRKALVKINDQKEKEIEQIKQEKLKALEEHEKQLFEVVEYLNNNKFPDKINDKNTIIANLLNQAIKNEGQWEKEFFVELLAIIENSAKCGYLPETCPKKKLPKIKYNKKKALVDQLSSLINDA